MKNIHFAYLILSALFLSSCHKNNLIDDETKNINDYVGEYSVYAMDWNKYGEKDVTTFDIDGDGRGTNDIVDETLKITDHSKWENSILSINKDEKTATLRAVIPVLDYYNLVGAGTTLADPPFQFAKIFFNVTINENGTLKSDKFDHLDWPDENRIGLKTFGGVQITGSNDHHIYITIDHYLIYDHKTSTLIDGYLKLDLIK
mgnify:CR=1 FL=1